MSNSRLWGQWRSKKKEEKKGMERYEVEGERTIRKKYHFIVFCYISRAMSIVSLHCFSGFDS